VLFFKYHYQGGRVHYGELEEQGDLDAGGAADAQMHAVVLRTLALVEECVHGRRDTGSEPASRVFFLIFMNSTPQFGIGTFFQKK
jgi:hypothetical protein